MFAAVGNVPSAKPSIRDVQAVICAGEGVALADLKSGSRKQRYSQPRQWAMALAREMTGQSYPVIGRHFGGKDHTTILYACREVSKRVAANERLAGKLEDYRRKVLEVVRARAAMCGCSTAWTPAMLKPTAVTVNLELDSWLALGGELEAAA